MQPLPPLKSLVAFDAAMRNQSFSAAASELCVTPGAVGQHIQKLEDWLGLSLFTRQVRHITPTAEAQAYWQRIQPALGQIRDASAQLRQQRSHRVAISVPPSFAAKWLARRIASFLARHPEVELHFNATTALVDFERDPIDLAIRYFDGHDPRLDTTRLFEDEVRCYCAPAYARQLGLQHPDDLVRATLLHTSMQPLWSTWLQRYSRLDAAQLQRLTGVHFDQGLMALEAAQRGQGITLSSPMLVSEEVLAGTLVDPFGLSLPVTPAYHVVHHRHLPLRAPALALKAWLIEEAAASQLKTLTQPRDP